MKRRTWKELDAITGGLSDPSKMPGKSTGTPAKDCIAGSRLRNTQGTTCSGCYAMKGAYVWPTVAAAYQRRLDALDNPGWVEAMAESIDKASRKVPYFRQHDSGDLQSVEHLLRIFKVCELTPEVNHWLPTREYAMVRKALTVRDCPPNLVIRVSAVLVDGRPPALGLVHTSTVHADGDPYGFACEANTRKGHCGDCRACWSPNVPNVSYPLH